MTDTRGKREREIVQLQRMIEADQAPGCLKGIVGYFRNGNSFSLWLREF